MEKKIGVLILTGMFLFATPALAAKKAQTANIDFGSFTCAEFISEVSTSSEEDTGAVLLWLDGYLSGVSGDEVLNWQGLESFTEKLVTYCSKNGKRGLLDAAKKVGIE